MSLLINFELSKSDLERFFEAMLRIRERAHGKTTQQITDSARQLLTEINCSDATDFIRDRMSQLETLVNMATDQGWGLADDDLERVLNALTYFCESADLIPDSTPALGYLDDAIMIEIICKELEHEIQAFNEFVMFRDAEVNRLGADAQNLPKSDWLEERRQQLHARMRRRHKSDRRKVKSPFSML